MLDDLRVGNGLRLHKDEIMRIRSDHYLLVLVAIALTLTLMREI